MEHLFHLIKAERVVIDKEIKSLRELSRNAELSGYVTSRAISLSVTKLEEAKMWLGKALESLGSPLPEEYRDEYKDEL